MKGVLTGDLGISNFSGESIARSTTALAMRS